MKPQEEHSVFVRGHSRHASLSQIYSFCVPFVWQSRQDLKTLIPVRHVTVWKPCCTLILFKQHRGGIHCSVRFVAFFSGEIDCSSYT